MQMQRVNQVPASVRVTSTLSSKHGHFLSLQDDDDQNKTWVHKPMGDVTVAMSIISIVYYCNAAQTMQQRH